MINVYVKKRLFPYILILPSLILVLGVLGYGIIGGVFLSFFKLDVMFGTTFVGLENYRKVFSDPRFIKSLLNTLVFVSSSVVFCTVFSFISALTLNSIHIFGQFFRSMSLVPYFVSGIATAVMWRFMFSTNAGLVNWVLGKIGVHEISWLGQSGTAMLISILATSWFIIPAASLILLGGMQTIEKELYEAANLDGSSAVRSLFSITIPLMKPIIGVVLVWISYASFSTFDIILALTGGGPFQSTEILALYMYTKGFLSLNFGEGLVVMLVILGFNITLSMVYYSLLVKEKR